jgi:Leucine-rich repeat (LRR) protein
MATLCSRKRENPRRAKKGARTILGDWFLNVYKAVGFSDAKQIPRGATQTMSSQTHSQTLLSTGLLILAAFLVVSGLATTTTAWRQQKAVEAIFSKGGCVAYTFNRRPNNMRPPKWMMSHRVCDYFFRVIGVGVLDCADFQEGDLQVLDDLPNLSVITLQGPQFTDASIGYLIGLKELRVLDLSRTRITDAGLGQLAHLASLNKLVVSHSLATADGCARLQKKLPNCRIIHDSIAEN